MGKKTEGRIMSETVTVDCTPDWVPIIRYAVQWIKDAKQFEKSYRKDCTDYDGAMEAYTETIMDCAKGLDMMNREQKRAHRIVWLGYVPDVCLPKRLHD